MYYVYIMASRPGGALYIGSTNDLRHRVEQHRSGCGGVHTAKYKNRTLVWFEAFPTCSEALTQERRIKKWRRSWKDQLILACNPEWRDMTAHIPYA